MEEAIEEDKKCGNRRLGKDLQMEMKSDRNVQWFIIFCEPFVGLSELNISISQ